MQALDDFRLELGEGPGYDPLTDTAWWFDIPARRLYTRVLAENRTIRHDLPVAASAMADTGDGQRAPFAGRGRFDPTVRVG